MIKLYQNMPENSTKNNNPDVTQVTKVPNSCKNNIPDTKFTKV